MPSQLFRRKPISSLQGELGDSSGGQGLAKNLGLLDLTCLGVAAVIGAGIFSTIGKAAYNGGPAVSILFIVTAIACLFSALCYAEFASRIPVSGSAYTYTYTTFGELCAWLIGWNLILEYAIGNSLISYSWSDYFVNLLRGLQIHPPEWLITDYYSCARAVESVAPTAQQQELIRIWNAAPQIGGLHILLDLPALTINIMVSALVLIGIKESKIASNAMVFLKMAVIGLVIAVGCFYVKPENWTPFAPNGVTGVLAGISSVFFTFIGFDAISTTAEECKDARRDLPKAMILTLVICTIVYVILSFVLTGMVSYLELDVSDPLAIVFEKYDLHLLAGIVSLSAVVAITSVFLVFQIGQPRIFMSMARDGLLPKRFSHVHPRFKTPAFATFITFLTVAIPTLFFNADIVLDLCSMGTLFAFMFVSAGVIVLQQSDTPETGPTFRVPYFNGRIWVPLCLIGYTFLMHYMPSNHHIFDWEYWKQIAAPFTETQADWSRIPYLFFYLTFVTLTVLSMRHNFSLIPVLGVVTNLYLLAGMGAANWILFAGWCSVGLLLYFAYGYWNSRLRNVSAT